MRGLFLTIAEWRRLVVLLAASALILVCGEIGSALSLHVTWQPGSLGIAFQEDGRLGPWGHDSHRLRVSAVTAKSPAADAGFHPGMEVGFLHPLDRWRKLGAGETIILLRYGNGTPQQVQLIAGKTTIAGTEVLDSLGRCALSMLALALGVLIGWKKPGSRSYRQLALCFLALSLTAFYTFSFSPALLFYAGKTASLVSYGPIWYFAASFAMAYASYDTTPLRTSLRTVMPGYRLLAAASAAYALWFALGQDAPGLSLLVTCCVLCGLVITVASLVDGMRQARGNQRMRHLWLLLAFSAGALPPALAFIPDTGPLARSGIVVAIFIGQAFMYCTLVYAVLRHHVFEFDLPIVLRKVTVLGIATLLLLFLFGLTDHLAGEHIREWFEHDWTLKVLAMLPVVALLDRIRHRTEHWVRYILFHAAVEREQAFEEFLRRAVHFTSAEALLAALVTALDRFSKGAGAAVYLARDGEMVLAAASLPEAPPVLALSPEQRAAFESISGCDRAGNAAIPGELVLPMCHGGRLEGLVLMAPKKSKASYWLDERKLLVDAVRKIGLSLDTIHVARLEARIDALSYEAALLDRELQLAAGRRNGLRAVGGR